MMKLLQLIILGLIATCLFYIASRQRLVVFDRVTTAIKKAITPVPALVVTKLTVSEPHLIDPPMVVTDEDLLAVADGDTGWAATWKSRNKDRQPFTNWVDINLTVHNASDNYISEADFQLFFFDSWGNKLTSDRVFTGALLPRQSVILRESVFNYDKEQVAGWEVEDPYLKIQYRKGEKTIVTEYTVMRQ